jgi:hypothetical protein
MTTRSILLTIALAVSPLTAAAQPAPNVVTQWAAIVQQSIHNAAAPRSAGSSQVLHTMVHLAVYDAVVAIEGRYEPFIGKPAKSPAINADVRAAVATAAYLTARARVAASQFAFLDQEYAAFMAALPDGTAKTDGIRVGTRAAAAIVEARADDGFNNIVLYECSAIPPPPGEFEPDSGCPAAPGAAQPVDAKVGQIKPYTFKHRRNFEPGRPERLTSAAYARDFDETRDYGRADSAIRSAEQTDIAFFWSENPYVHWNRNLTALAVSRQLDVMDTARLFAMVQTAVSDAVIVGFDAKYRYGFWRPRTAIPQADADGNADTVADPNWRPLLSVNHPEYPSGHGFWSTALIDALAEFFGTTDVEWTITTSKIAVPRVEKAARTYADLETLKQEIFDARIWGGLHWRFSTTAGSGIGRDIARHVTKHFFRPRP